MQQDFQFRPIGGGLQWVTVATYENPVSGAVRLYDSGLALGVSTSIEMSVCNMLLSPKSSISIRLMNNDIQPNTNECGVYAIAFAISLAFCKRPGIYIGITQNRVTPSERSSF